MKDCKTCDYKRHRSDDWCYKYAKEPKTCSQYRSIPVAKKSDDTR